MISKKRERTLKVVDMRGSSGILSPYVIITGAVHGNELNGTFVIHSLLKYFNQHPLVNGRILFIPVVSETSVKNCSRGLKEHDPNRKFGTLQQNRIYNRLTDLIVDADVLLDLHTASRGCSNMVQVRTDVNRKEVKRLLPFACQDIIHEPGKTGMLRTFASQHGVAALTYEIGSPGVREPEVIYIVVKNILNILRFLGMDQHMVPKIYTPSIYSRHIWVKTKVPYELAFIHVLVQLGDTVNKGNIVANITSVVGTPLRMIRSPVTGVVVGVRTDPTLTQNAIRQRVIHIAITVLNRRTHVS